MEHVYLGYERDSCSGLLKVKNRRNRWVTIPRGMPQTTVEVAPDGDGWWYWRCGSSLERSRGSPNFRQRVKLLTVLHSKESGMVLWSCYDVMP